MHTCKKRQYTKSTSKSLYSTKHRCAPPPHQHARPPFAVLFWFALRVACRHIQELTTTVYTAPTEACTTATDFCCLPSSRKTLWTLQTTSCRQRRVHSKSRIASTQMWPASWNLCAQISKQCTPAPPTTLPLSIVCSTAI